MVESLGPKPTKLQMELLKKLAQPGSEIHWHCGTRGPSSARLVLAGQKPGEYEKIRTDTLDKFHSWGWVVAIGDKGWAWRNNEYTITEKGRKVVEKGELRK